ncbi:MAG: hypothetical protein DWI30_01415 [Chloroflexi bacterium]|jgi:hypothetical protein|nr:MAG: hypothetical protein DWI30_01415 [Chloroflexota bacterium]
MQRLLVRILTCFILVGCAATTQNSNIPDPPDAVVYQVRSSSSLPGVMDAYALNMYAMLRAKSYRVTQDISYVRVMQPIEAVAQVYDQSATAQGWSIDTPMPPRERRMLRSYRKGNAVVIVTFFAEVNNRDGIVVMRITAER